MDWGEGGRDLHVHGGVPDGLGDGDAAQSQEGKGGDVLDAGLPAELLASSSSSALSVSCC